jgi:hypothetical protein
MVRAWILADNLQPLVNELSDMAGEELDEGIRFLVLDEIAESNSDASPPRLASCEFDGPRPIAAKVASSEGPVF